MLIVAIIVVTIVLVPVVVIVVKVPIVVIVIQRPGKKAPFKAMLGAECGVEGFGGFIGCRA